MTWPIWPENLVVGAIFVLRLCPPRAMSGVEEALAQSGTIWRLKGSLLRPEVSNIEVRVCRRSMPATARPSGGVAPL